MQQSKQVLEWQAEALQRGRAEGKVEAVLRLLQRRTGKVVPPSLAATIRRTTDLATLYQWVDTAADATSLKEFRRQANL